MITSQVEHITPKIANEMLKFNSRNPRKRMDMNVIRKYAEDIRQGLWQLNGEAIVFDEDGFLVNGQHRLCGVIKANKAIDTLVVRGVERGVNIFDTQYRRTTTQNVNAKSSLQINPNISAAAGIVVNKFGPVCGQGVLEDYILKNDAELERAYRIVCYGGQGHPKSKCGPCIAAGYLALRTESIPSYELEVFFRRFNNVDTYELSSYDASSAHIARKMFDEIGSGRSGHQIQKEKLEIIVLGLEDFHNGIHREEDYRIAEPFHFSKWMDAVRRKDGLDR